MIAKKEEHTIRPGIINRTKFDRHAKARKKFEHISKPQTTTVVQVYHGRLIEIAEKERKKERVDLAKLMNN